VDNRALIDAGLEIGIPHREWIPMASRFLRAKSTLVISECKPFSICIE
jgi:hypothetical protein